MYILKHLPHVLVIQETSVQSGRERVQGVFNYAHIHGPWHLQLIQQVTGEIRPETLRDWQGYDGLIVGQMLHPYERFLHPLRKPMVLFDPLDETVCATSPLRNKVRVLLDNAAVGRLAAQHLLSLGLQHFGYYGDRLHRNWSLLRDTAFQAAIQAAGFTCSVLHPEQASESWRANNAQLIRWLTALPKPIGLFAAMDINALHVINACAEAGLRMPQDVAILGVDNDEIVCNGITPTLSSIQCDFTAAGFMAAQLLDRQMRRVPLKQKVYSYGVKGVVVRESTRAEACIHDFLAKRAYEFIRINSGAGISVTDIVRHLHVSRRLLEMRFRVAYGCSLLDAMQKIRLERVCKLLISTSLSLNEICAQCGYRSETHARRVFKKQMGCTMRDYRSTPVVLQG